MGREPGRRGALLRATAALVAVAAITAAAGCAAERRAAGLRPLGRGPGGTTTVLAAPTAAPTIAGPTGTGPTTAAPATVLPAGPAAAIADVLARYDRALTDLSRRPAAAPDPASPERLALAAVVPPGSLLSDDVLATATARSRDGVVVRPGPGGWAYRHHVLRAAPGDDGSIGFTWCGWSPGVAQRADGDQVVDDGVGHAHGTGRARLTDTGAVVLESLDQTDLTVLPPGATDPCPAEVARTATGTTPPTGVGP